jgi:putative heme iron utilization protein
MQPTASFSAATLARSLLRRRRQGALATLAVGTGAPYCSLVNLASHWDGSPILLISRLALHTQNILADPRVSLMLDERAEGDPLEGARIMLSGTAVEVGADAVDAVRDRYLNAHPAAELFAGFADFAFFVIRLQGAHLVAGFGRIVDLRPDQLLTDLSDAHALLAGEKSVIAHMNADHLDTMRLYAEALGVPEGDWRCTGCDPDGLDLQTGTRTLRLSFPQRTTTLAALRDALKQIADQARTATKLDPYQTAPGA